MAKGRVSKPTASRKGKGRQTVEAPSSRVAASAAAQIFREERDDGLSQTNEGYQPSASKEQDVQARISQQLEAILANQAAITARLDRIEAAQQDDRNAIAANQASITARMDQINQETQARVAQQLQVTIANQDSTMTRLNQIERNRTTDRDTFVNSLDSISREVDTLKTNMGTVEARQSARLHEINEHQTALRQSLRREMQRIVNEAETSIVRSIDHTIEQSIDQAIEAAMQDVETTEEIGELFDPSLNESDVLTKEQLDDALRDVALQETVEDIQSKIYREFEDTMGRFAQTWSDLRKMRLDVLRVENRVVGVEHMQAQQM